jgi:very-short-patch-repair endonuclease
MKASLKTGRARQLRLNPTDAEQALWQTLKGQQLGFKFRRQYPIASYIADFACLERKIVVEVDGSQHLNSAYDRERDRLMVGLGWTVLRFWNDDILLRIEPCLETVWNALHSPPQPSPLAGREPKTEQMPT